jgi:surface protein
MHHQKIKKFLSVTCLISVIALTGCGQTSDTAASSEVSTETQAVSVSTQASSSAETTEAVQTQESTDTSEEYTIKELLDNPGTLSDSGNYGDVVWNVYDSGLLTVTGSCSEDGALWEQQNSVDDTDFILFPTYIDECYISGSSAPADKNNICAPWYSSDATITKAYVNVSGVKNLAGLFMGLTDLEEVDLSDLDTSAVENMRSIFACCYNLTSADLSNFDTANVTNMSDMFSYCSNLTDVNVSSFDTHNTSDMSGMFSNCENLGSLDINNFNTENVKSFNSMFFRCLLLEKLDLTGFDTRNAKDMGGMFSGCSSLTEITVSSAWEEHFNGNKTAEDAAIFENCGTDSVTLSE